MTQQKQGFSNGTADYRISTENNRWTIRAKDFPMQQEFRVYSVHGDITDLPELHRAICNLLTERNVGNRRIIVNI